MKKLIFLVCIIQGVLVSAVIDHITIKESKIPIIYEQDKTLPIVSMQLIFKKSGSVEDKAQPGLGKFSAKVLNEGTKNWVL
jgi:predicted Zn-dependent peptidase